MKVHTDPHFKFVSLPLQFLSLMTVKYGVCHNHLKHLETTLKKLEKPCITMGLNLYKELIRVDFPM